MPLHAAPAPLVRVALLLALATSACGRGDNAADSSAPASAATPGVALRSQAPASADGLPGRLDRPIDRYTPDEFAAFVQSLGFSGGVEKARKCKGSPGCGTTGKERTNARIDAVTGQDSLSALSVPEHGVVALKVRNLGKFEEAGYGLQPGPYDYYVIVLPGQAGGSTWGLHELTTTPGARRLRLVASGPFTPCNHAGTSPKPHSANFASCGDAHSGSDSVLRMPLLLQGAQEAPMWVMCMQGCCTIIR